MLRLQGAVRRRRSGRMLDCLDGVNLRRFWSFVNTGLWRRRGPRVTDGSEVILLPAAATIVATRGADSRWRVLQKAAVTTGGWRNLLVGRTRHGGDWWAGRSKVLRLPGVSISIRCGAAVGGLLMRLMVHDHVYFGGCSWCRCRGRTLQDVKLGDARFNCSAGFDGCFQVERSVSQEANSKTVVSDAGHDAIAD